LTLIGIKLLQEKFAENKAEWKMVAGKAFTYVKNHFESKGISVNISQLLQSVIIKPLF
jgi:hypothetical protein